MTPLHDADRQLLFGILALQNDFIDRKALIAALHTWAADKARPMAAILQGLGVLDPETADLLAALVRRHLSLHGDDAQQSLAALSSLSSVREDLEKITDPDIQASLPAVAATVDLEETVTFEGQAPAAGPRFRVLRFHARGGLGMVSVALDGDLQREVALKEIRPEFAGQPASRSRFVLEAEITGGLEHPGIVPIYGLGHFGDGRPYYTMRLIKGDSLKDAIAAFHKADREPQRDPGERALALRGLLMRFLDVCHAVAYAHSRGVLHRDLKPGNIMLGPFGETLVVDWGLAKVVGRTEGGDEATLRPPSASGSAETLPGSAVGTPAYMSPEQAEGRLEQLGPRSDVYSLGATLYCVLTGRAPFADGDLAGVLERVRRGAFPTPRQANPAVPKALEAIALKAMALRPEDRYESARDLVGDLERWLADEPVHAYREPAGVRLGRWVRRHRVLVTSTAAALVMGLLGLSAVLVVQTRARRLAEAQTELALEAIREYYTGVSEEVLLKQPEMKDLRMKLLQAPLRFYRRLKSTLQQGRAADSKTLSRLARASYALGRITSQVGAHPDAEAAYTEALAIGERLARAEPGVPEYQDDLAMTHNSLGTLYKDTSRPGPAEAAYQAALAIAGRLAKARPGVPEYQVDLARVHHNLGNLYTDTDRPGPAEAAYQAALTIRKSLAAAHPGVPEYQDDLAMTHNGLGNLYSNTGRPAQAEAAYQAALAIRERLAKARPDVLEYQRDLAGCYNNLAIEHARGGRPGPAKAAYQAALTIRKRLAEARPGVPEYQSDLAMAYNNLGTLEAANGRLDRAEAAYRAALAIRERLARAHPTVGQYAIDLGGIYANLGNRDRDRDDHDGSIVWYGKAIRTLEPVLRKEPHQPEVRLALQTAYGSRAVALSLRNRHAEALKDLDRTLALDEGRNLNAGFLNPEFLSFGAIMLARDGQVSRAATMAEPLERAGGISASTLYSLACAHALMATSIGRDPQLSEAERPLRAAATTARALALLERARAAGYFGNRVYLESFKVDPDLQALRDRDDFRDFLRDLEFPAQPFATEAPPPGPRGR